MNNMSICTLLLLRHSGFDFYSLYGASACNGGSSGNGSSIPIEGLVARKAFAVALGWSAALAETFPDEFAKSNPNWPDLIALAPLGDTELQGEAIDEYLLILEELQPLDVEDRAILCSRVQDIVGFAKSVYLGSRNESVQLRFL